MNFILFFILVKIILIFSKYKVNISKLKPNVKKIVFDIKNKIYKNENYDGYDWRFPFEPLNETQNNNHDDFELNYHKYELLSILQNNNEEIMNKIKLLESYEKKFITNTSRYKIDLLQGHLYDDWNFTM
jgi:hypothetical protein